MAANLADIHAVMAARGATYFADKNALKGTLTDTLKEVLPTLFFGVPRVWEKIQEKMIAIGESLMAFIGYEGLCPRYSGLRLKRPLNFSLNLIPLVKGTLTLSITINCH